MQPIFILDPEPLFHQVPLVIELPLKLFFLVLKHLSEALLDQVPVVVELFIAFLVGLREAARWAFGVTDCNFLLFLLLGRR